MFPEYAYRISTDYDKLLNDEKVTVPKADYTRTGYISSLIVLCNVVIIMWVEDPVISWTVRYAHSTKLKCLKVVKTV